ECLLSRLCGRNCFQVGYLENSREYEELENAVGCFARTLPMVARIENDFRFSDVFGRPAGPSGEALGTKRTSRRNRSERKGNWSVSPARTSEQTRPLRVSSFRSTACVW